MPLKVYYFLVQELDIKYFLCQNSTSRNRKYLGIYFTTKGTHMPFCTLVQWEFLGTLKSQSHQ